MEDIIINDGSNVKTETKADQYSCKTCNKQFRRKQQMVDHNNYVHKVNIQVCEVCSFEFMNHILLRQHIYNVHSVDEQLVCDVCNKVYKNVRRLNYHINEVQVRENSFCHICGKLFLNKYKLQKHVNRKVCVIKKNYKPSFTHGLLSNSDDRYCKICDVTCFSKRAFTAHKLQVHMREPLVCHLCSHESKSASTFRRHYKNKHKYEFEEANTAVVSAMKASPSWNKVRAPSKDQRPREPLNCELCPHIAKGTSRFGLDIAGNLRRHYTRKHSLDKEKAKERVAKQINATPSWAIFKSPRLECDKCGKRYSGEWPGMHKRVCHKKVAKVILPPSPDIQLTRIVTKQKKREENIKQWRHLQKVQDKELKLKQEHLKRKIKENPDKEREQGEEMDFKPDSKQGMTMEQEQQEQYKNQNQQIITSGFQFKSKEGLALQLGLSKDVYENLTYREMMATLLEESGINSGIWSEIKSKYKQETVMGEEIFEHENTTTLNDTNMSILEPSCKKVQELEEGQTNVQDQECEPIQEEDQSMILEQEHHYKKQNEIQKKTKSEHNLAPGVSDDVSDVNNTAPLHGTITDLQEDWKRIEESKNIEQDLIEPKVITETCKLCLITVEHLYVHMIKAHNVGLKPKTEIEPTLVLKKPRKKTVKIQQKVKQIEQSKPTICYICAKYFTTPHILQTHINHIHGNQELQKCNECGREFRYKNLLHNHTINVHKNDAKQCNICQKVMKNKTSLRKHITHNHANTQT